MSESVPYVIACGDEGVQINVGRRIAFVGAGLKLPNFDKIIPYLKKTFGDDLAVASNEESDWAKEKLDLSDWEQVNASVQQHTEVMADELGLLYAGYLQFTDPRQLAHGIKGHMVRPHKVHVANTICLTIAGGEQVFHLGHFLISADWIAEAPAKLVKEILQTQIDFYTKLAHGEKLGIVVEEAGELDSKLVVANKKKLTELGLLPD